MEKLKKAAIERMSLVIEAFDSFGEELPKEDRKDLNLFKKCKRILEGKSKKQKIV